MADHPWPYHRLPDSLGVIVHGPVLLARAPGVAVALRCVFAHPEGLHLTLVLVARGAAADRAGDLSQTTGGDRTGSDGAAQLPTLRLVVGVDGRTGPVDHSQQECSWGTGRFDLRADHVVGALPGDGRLAVTAGWPGIGLPEITTVLALADLDDLDSRVIRLP